MKYEIFLYEIGLIFLILTLIYLSIAIYKLTLIIKEKKILWIFTFLSSFILFFALISHIYANFIVIPKLEKTIGLLSSQNLKDPVNFNLIKSAIENIKNSLLLLKTFSFSCFFISSLLLTITTSIYIKWISK